MENHKYKTFHLLSPRKRGLRETLDQKKVMSIKNKQQKRLPFLKKGVYAKDTMKHRIPCLRGARPQKLARRRVYSKIYSIFPFVFLLALSGCMGIYEGGFECPPGVGVGCKSISDVNDLVNQGEIPKVPPEQAPAKKLEIWYAPRGNYQKNSLLNSDKPSLSKKEKRRGARSLDPKSI